jgi:hypothetical protein
MDAGLGALELVVTYWLALVITLSGFSGMVLCIGADGTPWPWFLVLPCEAAPRVHALSHDADRADVNHP